MVNKNLVDALNSVQTRPLYVEILLHTETQRLLEGFTTVEKSMILTEFVNLRLGDYLNAPFDGSTHLDFYENLKKEKKNGE